MKDDAIWVVDRINGAVAVLVRDGDVQCDDTRRRDIPVALLPEDIREGAVLRVPETDGVPDWEAARVDEELRRARIQEAEAALERLRRRDPGGDIAL
ncbi:MAG: DUF3006 domain-containing protein [Gemmatimonadota bacterium]|nr:DUF3006 domain-containing protein [Gemmatimonadota bacterium]